MPKELKLHRLRPLQPWPESCFGMGILMPVIYGVMGFIGGVIGAAVYNLVARWIGGIELEVE